MVCSDLVQTRFELLHFSADQPVLEQKAQPLCHGAMSQLETVAARLSVACILRESLMRRASCPDAARMELA